jgi:hypothetical protein
MDPVLIHPYAPQEKGLVVHVLRILALSGVLGTAMAPMAMVVLPTAALAQQAPTKQQLETAVKAANPTIGQLRQLRKLEPNVPNMTPAQLQQALQQIFSPLQLAAIRQSLQQQGVVLPGQ